MTPRRLAFWRKQLRLIPDYYASQNMASESSSKRGTLHANTRDVTSQSTKYYPVVVKN
jgi:hypothetical protein